MSNPGLAAIGIGQRSVADQVYMSRENDTVLCGDGNASPRGANVCRATTAPDRRTGDVRQINDERPALTRRTRLPVQKGI